MHFFLMQNPDFGFLFDIDGVLTRGKTVIPAAKRALKKITDSNGEFTVPTVFVTNAGNTLRKYKARQLSDLFDINVSAIVLASRRRHWMLKSVLCGP